MRITPLHRAIGFDVDENVGIRAFFSHRAIGFDVEKMSGSGPFLYARHNTDRWRFSEPAEIFARSVYIYRRRGSWHLYADWSRLRRQCLGLCISGRERFRRSSESTLPVIDRYVQQTFTIRLIALRCQYGTTPP